MAPANSTAAKADCLGNKFSYFYMETETNTEISEINLKIDIFGNRHETNTVRA
jgi:hypothetical protein